MEKKQAQWSESYAHTNGSLRPGLHFWKQVLVGGREGPRVLVPNTLLLNDPSMHWVYTNSRGCLEHSRSASFKDFVSRTTAYCSPNELAVVFKRATNKDVNGSGCDIKLYNCRFLHKVSAVQLGDQLVCLQKYIKTHGNHAFACRTFYSTTKASFAYVLTNHCSFQDHDQPQAKRFVVNGADCLVVKAKEGAHLQQTKQPLQEIVEWMRRERGIELTDIVGDFLKDEEGHWWLINVRAFIAKTIMPREVTKKLQKQGKERYQKTKACKYCQKVFLQSELTHKVTRKMMLQLDRYLIHLQKQFEWLSKRQSFNSLDLHCLYQDLSVCKRCYSLYSEAKSLMALEHKLYTRIGFSCEQPFHNNTLRLQQEAKLKQINNLTKGIPQVIDLGPNSKIQIHDNCPIRRDQIINKMYRYKVILYLHELYQMSPLKPNFTYNVQFSLLGVKTKFKLDNHQVSAQAKEKQTKQISIRKLKISYLFARSNEQVHSYIANSQPFELCVVGEHRKTAERSVAGKLILELKDLISVKSIKKTLYKCLDGQNSASGIQISVGVQRSPEPVNTSRLILKSNDKLVYFPPSSYYSCEELPAEWVEEIQKKKKHQSIINKSSYVQQGFASSLLRNTTDYKQNTLSTCQQSLFREIQGYQFRNKKHKNTKNWNKFAQYNQSNKNNQESKCIQLSFSKQSKQSKYSDQSQSKRSI